MKEKLKTEKTCKGKRREKKIHSFSSIEAAELAALVKKKVLELIKDGNTCLLIHVLTNFFENPREVLESHKREQSFELLEGIKKQILRLNETLFETDPSTSDNSPAKKKHLSLVRKCRLRKNDAGVHGSRDADT